MFRQLALLLTCLCCTTFCQADWPQFMGPNRNGISSETGLLRQWPENGPPVRWTQEVGPGFGGAAIVDGRVFILDRQEDRYDVLRCFSLRNGEQQAEYRNEVRGRLSYEGSRSVPTVTADAIYAIGAFGHVYCIDRNTGQLRWGVNMVDAFGGRQPNWGYGFSPLVLDDIVIVVPMGDQASLVALETATGQPRWKAEPLKGHTYTSPIKATIAGQEGILYYSGQTLIFVHPKTGRTIFRYDGISHQIAIPFPTVIDQNRVFVTGAYDGGSVMLRVNRCGDNYDFDEVFRFDRQGAMVHPVLYYKDVLYGNFNTNENIERKAEDGLVCLTTGGKLNWQTGMNPSINRGGFIIADGLIILLEGLSGDLVLAEANPEKYTEISRFKLFEGGRESNIWAPLALSNGNLIVRDQENLKCLLVGRPSDRFGPRRDREEGAENDNERSDDDQRPRRPRRPY